jgi:general transcription factor 3C protein 4
MPFVSRMIVQSLLPGSPPDLSEEGRNLSDLVKHLVVGTRPLTPFDIANQLNETCPACGIQVPLKDITMAVCDNGHSWRVSSLFLIIFWLKLLLK